MNNGINIESVIRDFFPQFLADSWSRWLVVLRVLFSLPLSDEESAIFVQYARRQVPAIVRELWLICGRRSGKSTIAALIALYLACFVDHGLKRGERGTGMIICPDRKQARVILNYIRAFMESVPMLAAMIEQTTKESIRLTNGITIETHTASYRSTRGYCVVFCIVDEIAFLRDETSSTPDREILAAIRPAMLTVPDARLICISSPYAKRGELYRIYRDAYGKDAPELLVWQAGTRDMNPTIDQRKIDEAVEADPTSARAEFFGEFRNDVEAPITDEVLADAVATGVHVIPALDTVHYFGFHDAAGGSGKDSMTSAVAHKEFERIVLDSVLETRPPFSPEASIKEHAEFFRSYHVSMIESDRYAGMFPVEQFAKHGITCRPSEKSKSEIYAELVPMFNSRRVRLLDNKRLIVQVAGLERRNSSGGRFTIDHGVGLHDDLINAAGGALLLAHTLGYVRHSDQPMRVGSGLQRRTYADRSFQQIFGTRHGFHRPE